MTDKDLTPTSETQPESTPEQPGTPQQEVVEKEVVDAVVDQPTPDGGAEPASKSEPAAPEDPEKGPTLDDKLGEPEAITYTKSKAYPRTTEGDLVKDGEGYVVKSQHTYSDIDKMFDLSGHGKPNPKLFFNIVKNDPGGADRIAKACGWRSASYMRAAVDDYVKAGTQEERETILKNDFPRFTWDANEDLPFEVDIQNENTPGDVKTSPIGFSNSEIEAAVNSFVADNGVPKDAIMKSAKVREYLEEFSDFQSGGKQISATKALEMAINMAGITSDTKLSKPDKVATGGNPNPKRSPSKKKGELSKGAKDLAAKYGYSL